MKGSGILKRSIRPVGNGAAKTSRAHAALTGLDRHDWGILVTPAQATSLRGATRKRFATY